MVHMEKQKTVAVGPWGGTGGINKYDELYDGVSEIRLTWGQCIDSIQVVYKLKNGEKHEGQKHGGDDGSKKNTITLEPGESLNVVTGHYSKLSKDGNKLVRSLKFITNRRTCGPYGVEDGDTFSVGGKFVGIFGRSGWYLDSIGFYLETC